MIGDKRLQSALSMLDEGVDNGKKGWFFLLKFGSVIEVVDLNAQKAIHGYISGQDLR